MGFLWIRAKMSPLLQPPDKTKSMGSVLMKSVKTLQAGDVIFTDRVLYRHYGVYAGNMLETIFIAALIVNSSEGA